MEKSCCRGAPSTSPDMARRVEDAMFRLVFTVKRRAGTFRKHVSNTSTSSSKVLIFPTFVRRHCICANDLYSVWMATQRKHLWVDRKSLRFSPGIQTKRLLQLTAKVYDPVPHFSNKCTTNNILKHVLSEQKIIMKSTEIHLRPPKI